MHRARVDVFRVDTSPREDYGSLHKDIEIQVEHADILVADVTGKNPNVHIEVGLAIASGKEVLLCTQKKEDVCTHLLDRLFIVYHPTAGGLDELSRQIRLSILGSLRRASLEREARRLTLQLAPTYHVSCYKDRAIANLGKVFSGAKRGIDILTTNLSWLLEKDPLSKKSDWECIREAIESNERVQLRILTLDPQSEIAAQRARQLGFDPGNFRNQLQRAYDEVKTFAAKFDTSRVEVRLYNELPTQITFHVDYEVYTCIVGQPMQSRSYPVLKFDEANLGVKEAFISHFLAVWKEAIR